jgi:hypothetical protein
MKAAFTQMQRISANDPGLDRAKNICDESLVDSMKLEEVRRFPCLFSIPSSDDTTPCSQIIVTCIFANFEKFCGIDPDTSGFSTFLNNVRWDLPEVPWSWDSQPPPPPPSGNTDAKGHYMELDPVGVVRNT